MMNVLHDYIGKDKLNFFKNDKIDKVICVKFFSHKVFLFISNSEISQKVISYQESILVYAYIGSYL